ncbi:MAG TPA: HlyD family efflux transporter periplasmic adaptor subunit [Polyangiaceae bacterium]|nr:HlyD family efflux transporter periplasmic adaptor subunit [Polyangiaceae bacterium]
MIKNWLLPIAALLVVAGIGLWAWKQQRGAPVPSQLAGVVEFEERVFSFEVPGRVTALPVARGARVKEGSVLAVLDDSLERAQRAARAAEASAADAQLALLVAGARSEDVRSLGARVRAAGATQQMFQTNLDRERALYERGSTPVARVDDLASQLARATAERQALEQNLSALRKGARGEEVRGAEAHSAAARAVLSLEDERLSRHRLRATHAGSVLDVHVESGEVVAAGTPVATVADSARPYVDVFVPIAELARVRLGGAAHVRIDARDRTFSGRVEHIAQHTEFTPRYLFSERERPNLVVRVRVRVDDPREQLYAGVPAFVELAAGS